jgi:hypothetical protein
VIHARDYQIDATDRVFEEWKAARSTLVVMATGLGKTVVATNVCKRVLAGEVGPGSFLFFAHRDELVTQARDTFRAAFPGRLVEIEKATSLMLTGKYEPRLGEQTPVPVEELIIAGQYQAPAEALNPEMVTVRRAEFEARIAEIRKQVEGETIAKLRAEADEAEKARAQKIRDEILAEMRANQSAQPPADPPTEAAGQKADDKGGKQSGKAGK